MSRLIRIVVLAVTLSALVTGTAQATVPHRAEGVGCTSPRACTTTTGGALMLTSSVSCTAGLPVRTWDGRWFMVTAGHCVYEGGRSTWRQSGVALGKGYRWEYGGKGTEGAGAKADVGLIKLTRKSSSRVLALSGGKARMQAITAVRDARVGERVCVTAGRTGGTRCGTVVVPTTSLRYASPGLAARTITGLALVKGICIYPGDSGSPVYAGRTAVGIAVARSASGCYTWYTKLPAQLRHFGLRVG
ncbi:MAG TPA: S1 family peptidase [Mycobacteriales bacterium]|nr:S1 family peptidase [Mycobacteriales bacterium]